MLSKRHLVTKILNVSRSDRCWLMNLSAVADIKQSSEKELCGQTTLFTRSHYGQRLVQSALVFCSRDSGEPIIELPPFVFAICTVYCTDRPKMLDLCFIFADGLSAPCSTPLNGLILFHQNSLKFSELWTTEFSKCAFEHQHRGINKANACSL